MINEYLNLVVAKPTVAYAAKTGGGTIANIYEINLLAPGAIAIFTEENVLVTTSTSAPSLVGTQQFWIAMGSLDGHAAIKTAPIDRNAFHQLKTAYVAPAKQVTIVGENSAGNGSLNLPVTLVTDTSAFLRVAKMTGTYQAGDKLSYEVPVAVGETGHTLVTKMVALINNNPESIVVAAAVVDTGVNVGISLTSKEFGVAFEVGKAELFANATVWKDGLGTSVTVVQGQGTLAQLAQLESEADITTRGKSNSMGQQHLWWKQPSELEFAAATNFVTYNFKWKTEHNVGAYVKDATINHAVVGIATGDGLIATFDTILGLLSQAPETGSGASPEGEFSE
jgi:hypothetical protein